MFHGLMNNPAYIYINKYTNMYFLLKYKTNAVANSFIKQDYQLFSHTDKNYTPARKDIKIYTTGDTIGI
jgi:hypothetical protein